MPNDVQIALKFFRVLFHITTTQKTYDDSEDVFAIILNYDSINTPYLKISISRRRTTKREKKKEMKAKTHPYRSFYCKNRSRRSAVKIYGV